MRFWDFLEGLLVKLDLGPIRGRIPYPVAYGAGFVVESIARLRGVEPSLSRLGAGVASKSMFGFGASSTSFQGVDAEPCRRVFARPERAPGDQR